MNSIENFFLEIGLNWTLSKALPYLIALLLGAILVFFILKIIRTKKKWLRISIGILLFPLFFVAYFVLHPIFEGDFSNNGQKIQRTISDKEIKNNQLTVLTIPGCPYCAESMNRMKQLKLRNPKIQIDYVVVHGDSSSIEWYKSMAGDSKIDVRLATENEEMSKLAQGKYPTFVRSEEKLLTCWNNDGFGVRALDEVESVLGK
jgi:glutaredoxin